MKKTLLKLNKKNYTLTIMRGLPGSGKSTLAMKIARNSNHVFSTDDYWGEDYDFNYELLELAHRWNRERVKTALAVRLHNVVVDNTNVDVKAIQPYIELAKRYKYNVVLVEPNTSWKFDVERCCERTTHNVPKGTIQKMLDNYQDCSTIQKLF